MDREELLAEIKRHSGTVEPIKKECQFQSSIQESFYDYCKQIKDQNEDYIALMGLDGGLGVYCWGTELPYVIDREIHHKHIPPCPFRGDDTILGWKIMLPMKSG